MLYISRNIGAKQFGVVDSDTGAERIMSMSALRDFVLVEHADIEGVKIISTLSGLAIGEITPYQDIKYCTSRQVKLRVVSGVDIRTYKDEITTIIADNNIVKRDTRIRLSDYGSRMDGLIGIRWRNVGFEFDNFITLVVDDDITIVGTPPNPIGCGVRWDVSECNNDYIVSYLYRVLQANKINTARWSEYIVDSRR